VLTYPNADTGHAAVVEAIERFAASGDRYTLVRNLGTDAYFTLLGRAAAMVGNSSSGIIEAASFGLPVVDVGIRQQRRIRARNVLHAESDRDSIAAAIRRAVAADFRESLAGLENPYGDGHASERIVETLATVPLDEKLLVKRFCDLRG
jgi:UDP-N-acetylglucosamine 2-epimerase